MKYLKGRIHVFFVRDFCRMSTLHVAVIMPTCCQTCWQNRRMARGISMSPTSEKVLSIWSLCLAVRSLCHIPVPSLIYWRTMQQVLSLFLYRLWLVPWCSPVLRQTLEKNWASMAIAEGLGVHGNCSKFRCKIVHLLPFDSWNSRYSVILEEFLIGGWGFCSHLRSVLNRDILL